ncbi:MAG: M1 family metallopeptidase [Anaerolineae bacterium]|nr:M1 family metallopeptidase [Anaerolineae bacterium]
MANIKLLGLVVMVGLLVGCGFGEGPIVEGDPAPRVTITPTSLPTAVNTAVPANTTTSPDTAVVADIVAGERSIGDSYAPELGNTGYDVLRYTIQLNLDPALEYELDGAVIIDAVAALDDLGEMSLDFIGFEIDELLANGQPADFRREEGKLIITLPEPLASEEPFQLTIRYQGEAEQEPSPYVGFASWLGLFYAQDDTIYILSEPDGSRYWFPNNDHPRDKATYRFEITVPEGNTAVANGRLVSAENNTFIWEHNYPMASYLATIVVGDYERLEGQSPAGIPLRDYIFPASQSQFERATASSREAIDWMSDLFGDYPYEEFGFVSVHAPGVSLETQTMVLLSTGMFDEQTAVHELAHMWFGDWVSLDSWGEMWRNEGFATYLSFLWEYRDDPDGLELYMEGIRAFLEDNNELGKPLRNPPPAELFSAYTYVGGALMIHELRQEMGDDAFFAGLKNYFQQYAHGTASDEEFIAVMEAAASKSLAAFFSRWLEGE